jgi:biopolymer transport protein ExbD
MPEIINFCVSARLLRIAILIFLALGLVFMILNNLVIGEYNIALASEENTSSVVPTAPLDVPIFENNNILAFHLQLPHSERAERLAGLANMYHSLAMLFLGAGSIVLLYASFRKNTSGGQQ